MKNSSRAFLKKRDLWAQVIDGRARPGSPDVIGDRRQILVRSDEDKFSDYVGICRKRLSSARPRDCATATGIVVCRVLRVLLSCYVTRYRVMCCSYRRGCYVSARGIENGGGGGYLQAYLSVKKTENFRRSVLSLIMVLYVAPIVNCSLDCSLQCRHSKHPKPKRSFILARTL